MASSDNRDALVDLVDWCRQDYILVTAWNYFDTIRNKEAWYDGIWILPAPDLRLV